MIKKTLLGAAMAVLFMTACQNAKQDQKEEYQTLAEKAIEIHDEIMPQISKFDKTSIKIDSILSNLEGLKAANASLDTTNTRTDLKELQSSIESATDFMMEWMKGYEPDSTDVAYQEKEVERVTKMKQQFEDVDKAIQTKMTPFN